MEKDEILDILKELSDQIKKNEEIRKEIKYLNKMTQDILSERIKTLESAMREFISEYTATVGRHDQFDPMEQDILLNAYVDKFKKLLDEKESNKS